MSEPVFYINWVHQTPAAGLHGWHSTQSHVATEAEGRAEIAKPFGPGCIKAQLIRREGMRARVIASRKRAARAPATER